MGNFLTLVQPTSSNTDLYNYRGTGFVKLRNVSSVGTQDDVYTLTHTASSTQETITFTVTSASLANVADKTGLAFIIDTTLEMPFTQSDSLYNSDTEKYIKIGNYPAVKLISTFKNPGSTPTPRNPIITTGAEYLIVYNGTSFVVMNEAMMIDADTYNTYFSEGIRYMAAPTIDFMMRYVGEQINTRYTYLVCPPEASLIPSGAEYKENASATAITGTMDAGASNMYIIYLVLHNVHTGGSDVYDEWICINTGTTSEPSYSWEKIGNTDVTISHTHNIPLGGAHSHKIQKGGAHSHSVTVTPTLETVSSEPGAGNVYATLSVPQAPANTGKAGEHSHTLEYTGSHTHTMNPVGSHSHSVTVTPTLETVSSKPGAGNVYATLSVPQAPANTGNAGEHSHTLEYTGSHTHTMNPVGSHSHSVTVTVTGMLSTSDDGVTYGTASNTISLEVPTPNSETGGAGGHDHTLEYTGNHKHTVNTTNSSHSHTLADNGAHAHTMNESGGHSHTFEYTATVDGETLILPISSHTGNAGEHSHTLEYTGSHTHTMSKGGTHSHTLADNGAHTHTMNRVGEHSHSITSGELWTKFIKIETSGSGSTGKAGAHDHTLEYAGAHAHTMNPVDSHSHSVGNTGTAWTKYIKITTSASSGLDGAHDHTLEYAGAHAHTMNAVEDHSHTVGNEGTAWTRYIKITTSASSGLDGAHSHTINSGGEHSHTTGQPIS